MKKVIQHLRSNRIVSILLAIAWTILIYVGCATPGRDLPPVHVFDHFDKVVHFTFFFVFSLLWHIVFYHTKYILLWLIVVSFVYGFALEFYQANYVPGREFDVWDGVFDTLGAVVFGGVIMKKR